MRYTLPDKSRFNSMVERLNNEINTSNIPDGETQFVFPSDPPSTEPDEKQLLTAEIERLQKELSEANISLLGMRSTIDSNQSEITKLKSDLEQADVDYLVLSMDKGNADTQISELQKKITDAETSYQILENENTTLKEKYSAIENELQEAKDAIKPDFVSVQELMNESRTLDKASRLNLITSLERLKAHKSGNIEKILEAERNTLNVEIKEEDYSPGDDGRSVFIVIKTLDAIFKKLSIVQKADNLKLARLYAHISGYSFNTIKNRLPINDNIPSRSREEAQKVQSLLNDVNSNISIH